MCFRKTNRKLKRKISNCSWSSFKRQPLTVNSFHVPPRFLCLHQQANDGELKQHRFTRSSRSTRHKVLVCVQNLGRIHKQISRSTFLGTYESFSSCRCAYIIQGLGLDIIEKGEFTKDGSEFDGCVAGVKSANSITEWETVQILKKPLPKGYEFQKQDAKLPQILKCGEKHKHLDFCLRLRKETFV